MIEFVLGGARSGKSNYAEQQAIKSEKQVIYIATAEARDSEMQSRINIHRQHRPQNWKTVEEPAALAKVIKKYDAKQHYLLIDCLTLWLSNILFDRKGELQQVIFKKQTDELLAILPTLSCQVILVTNEVGLGLIAMDKMTRLFVDEAGRLHQKIAALSDKVVFITAGLPQTLK